MLSKHYYIEYFKAFMLLIGFFVAYASPEILFFFLKPIVRTSIHANIVLLTKKTICILSFIHFATFVIKKHDEFHTYSMIAVLFLSLYLQESLNVDMTLTYFLNSLVLYLVEIICNALIIKIFKININTNLLSSLLYSVYAYCVIVKNIQILFYLIT